MRRLCLAVVILLAAASCAVAQGEDAPKGIKVKGAHNPFTLVIPDGWHQRPIESKVEGPDGTTELKVNVFGKKLLPTDNLDIWWYDGEEPSLDKGAISFHRIDLGREVLPAALPDEVKKDEALPKDAKLTLMQVGKFVGIHTAATVEDIATSTVTLINGKTAYVGILLGPKDVVKEQQPKFLKLLSTLQAEDIKPASLDEVLGVKPEEPLKPGQIKSKSGKFILDVPEGWKNESYDNPDDKPNSKLIMQVVPMEGALNITDNVNFWWSPLGENLLTGIASIHRLEWVEGDAPTVRSVVDGLKASGKLPQGMEANLVQVGDYAAAVVGGPYQNIFYGAGVMVSQGKVLYLASLLGPVAAVQPQWPAFMKLVTSLKTSDLTPQKLEDMK